MISKYRPVATISKFEIVSHWPVVLVGECLPQTLPLFWTVCTRSIYASCGFFTVPPKGLEADTHHEHRKDYSEQSNPHHQIPRDRKRKLTLELFCKRLNISMSTLIRQSLLGKPVQHTVLVTSGGEDALESVLKPPYCRIIHPKRVNIRKKTAKFRLYFKPFRHSRHPFFGRKKQ